MSHHRSVGDRASAAWFRFRSTDIQRATDLQQQGNKIERFQTLLAKNEENYAWTHYLNRKEYKYEPSNITTEVANFNRAFDTFEALPIRIRDGDGNNMVYSWLQARQKRIETLLGAGVG